MLTCFFLYFFHNIFSPFFFLRFLQTSLFFSTLESFQGNFFVIFCSLKICLAIEHMVNLTLLNVKNERCIKRTNDLTVLKMLIYPPSIGKCFFLVFFFSSYYTASDKGLSRKYFYLHENIWDLVKALQMSNHNLFSWRKESFCGEKKNINNFELNMCLICSYMYYTTCLFNQHQVCHFLGM